MKKVLVYFHTHWDREWYKTRVEFTFRIVKVFDDVLKKIKSGELPYFYFDGHVSALQDYLKFRPENERLIKFFIKEKKLFIGPFFCSTDSFLVSGQSFLANIDLGLKYSKHFGCNDFIGYCADTFGHSKDLPTIFNYYNFEGGIFWRGLGNLPQCFNWNGLKSIYLRQGYFHDYLNSNLSYEKKAKLIENQLKKIDDNTQSILLLPLGADHLKIADNVKEQITEINKYLKNYELIISNPFKYLKMMKPSKIIKNELRDNSRNFILPGVLSSRIDIKQKNSYSQWQLLRLAEPLNALCFSNGLTKYNYQPQINIAKEELVKNHAHDSIYGCSTDEVHNDMLRRFEIVNQTANSVIENILYELEEPCETINVINLSDYTYSGLCEIKTDKKLPFGQLIKKEFGVDRNLWLDENKTPVTEDFKNIYTYLLKTTDLQPFSISKITSEKCVCDLKITDTSIENSKIALKIKNGKFELTDKKTGKTYKNFIEIIDIADVGDSYNFAPVKNDQKIKAEIISSKIFVKGDFRSILKINLKIEIPEKSTIKGRSKKILNHYLNSYVILDAGSDFIKLKIDWINKSQNHILKAVFNFENPVVETISDDLLGIIRRKFNPDYDISKNIPAQRGIELKTNTAPMQTFVETQGVAVMTKGLNEYEISGNSLGVTILRSTDIISNPKNPARGTPAGPPIHTLNLLGLKANIAEFALTFNSSIEKIKACQQEYYGCTFGFSGNIKPCILTKIEGELLSAQHDNKLKIRYYNEQKIQDL